MTLFLDSFGFFFFFLSYSDNAELYGKVGVPFVMGTTGGDRDQLYKTVEDSKVYAVISPQMGKQVIRFCISMVSNIVYYCEGFAFHILIFVLYD